MADNSNNNGIPKGLRLVVRAWGACSALCCAALGFFVLFTLSATCFGIGIYMITNHRTAKIYFNFTVCCGGILVLTFEAPICCQYIPCLIKVSDWIDTNLKFWMRATMYFLFGFLPIIFCLEASTFIGGGAVVITSAMYGVLAIGRKGADVKKQQSDDIEMKANLVDNKGNPTADSESGL